MRRIVIGPLLLLVVSCGTFVPSTSKYQVRGTETQEVPLISVEELVGNTDEHRARQMTLEHRSVESFREFTLGIIEISDDGSINPEQKQQAIGAVKNATDGGGMLLIFVHGWHHSARTCDRDLACFRSVLAQVRKAHTLESMPKVAGLYIGWRGESLHKSGWNMTSLWNRKRVAERIGRTTGKEILVELNHWWLSQPDLTMITIGHSLGGAFLLNASQAKLTGGVSDIERGKPGWYSVVRAEEDRLVALKANRKAKRSELGDLVVLVNPAIEASAYAPFANDLPDELLHSLRREDLVARRFPYDRNDPYPCDQLPILMTVSSEADTAVGRLFPIASWIESIITLSWRHFRTESWHGMGRYAPQVTHHLKLTDALPASVIDRRRPRQIEAEDCGCPMSYEGLVATEPLDLADTKNAQTFGQVRLTDGGIVLERQYVLELTPQQAKRGWDSNAPYFVIEASRDVISEHSDIFNPVFMGFLLNFLDGYSAKSDARDKCRVKPLDQPTAPWKSNCSPSSEPGDDFSGTEKQKKCVARRSPKVE
jgi:hypothetical protein